MTPHMHGRPLLAAQTAGAILLTALLVSSPLPASAAVSQDSAVSLGQAPASETGASARTDPGPRPGAEAGTQPELGSSQEGSWFLGRPVDSVLGPGQWYTTAAGRTWYGAYQTFEDEYAYCVDVGLKTPHP